MRSPKWNNRGLALPIVFVFLVISQLVYMGLLRLNQLNMQHYRLFQQHYAASIQWLIARTQSEASSQDFVQQWEQEVQAIFAKKFADRIGEIPFEWLTAESYQLGAIQLSDKAVLVFEQNIEVLSGQFESPNIETSEELQRKIATEGYRVVEEFQSEDRGQWQPEIIAEKEYLFNTGSVHYHASHVLSEVFDSDARVIREVAKPQCEYLVKWRAFLCQEE